MEESFLLSLSFRTSYFWCTAGRPIDELRSTWMGGGGLLGYIFEEIPPCLSQLSMAFKTKKELKCVQPDKNISTRNRLASYEMFGCLLITISYRIPRMREACCVDGLIPICEWSTHWVYFFLRICNHNTLIQPKN